MRLIFQTLCVMCLSWVRRSFFPLWAVLGCACAASAPVQWRLQVRTQADWPDTSQLAERVEQVGGVPVAPEVAGIAPRSYALTLQCENQRACKRAAMKLAAQPDLFVDLRRDEVRHIPRRPAENTIQ
jgi:hypothetical protein